MRAAAAIALLASGCLGPGVTVRSQPTQAFPVTWDGISAAPAQVVAERAPAPVQAAPRIAPNRLVAVLELHKKLKGKDAEDVDATYFGNAVRTALKRQAPQAQVMTRENVLVMLEAQGKNLADCEGECEVDTGRRLGADLVVSGEIIRVGSRLKVDLRLHDTRSGQLLSGAAATGKNVDELDAAVESAVRQLVSG